LRFHELHVWIWDFPYGFMPTTRVSLDRDFRPASQFCKAFFIFFPVRPRFSLAKHALKFVPFHTLFHPTRRHPLRSCSGFAFASLQPDIAVVNLSRPIRSKIVWNNSRGTATSAIWKIIFREWRTTFAPILISFSRSGNVMAS
jgi:hypothetical protein